MSKKLLKILMNPHILLLLWVVFFLSPLLSVFRLYYVVNKNLLGFRISGFSSLLFYFPFFISLIVFVILIFWFRQFIEGKLSQRQKRILVVMSILTLVFLVLSGLLLNLEYNNYPNYLYAQYGITVSQLEFMSFIAALQLMTFLTAFIYDLTYKRISKTGQFRVRENELKTEKASLLLAVIGFLSLLLLSAYPFLNWSLLLSEAKEGFERKVGVHYKYLDLLANHTPVESTTIHPPQGDKWPAIGNQPVVRYFLYPRRLISGALLNNQEFSQTIGQAYFAEIDIDFELTHWPNINTNEYTIMFDEKTEIPYSRLEIVFETNEAKIFKVRF